MPTVPDVRAHLLAQDVVWVGGGSVANLLAVWRVHGLDEIFREVWEAGVVLGGVSAGSLCWHVGGTTDSFGPDLRPVTDGLALIPTSNGVHYDSEEQRRPLYHRLVADGTLPGGPRHRRRRRAGLPRHRARGGRRGPSRRGGLPGGARPRRHRGGDPPRDPAGCLSRSARGARWSARARRRTRGCVRAPGAAAGIGWSS